MLHDSPAYNHVWVAGDGVVSIGAAPPRGPRRGKPLAYTGVQVVDRKIFRYIPAQGAYDLVAAWREALKAGERSAYLMVSGHFWQDLGTRSVSLAAPAAAYRRLAEALAGFFPGLTDPLVGPGVRSAPGRDLAAGSHWGQRWQWAPGPPCKIRWPGTGPPSRRGDVGGLHRGRGGGGQPFRPGTGAGGIRFSVCGSRFSV